MADINALYCSLLAADEAGDAAALAAVAWQMYGQLATTAADLGALRARFRVYAAAPLLASRGAQSDACGGCVAGRRAIKGDVSADEERDRSGAGVAGHRGTTSTRSPAVRERSAPGFRGLPAAGIGRIPAITHERARRGPQVLAAPGQQLPASGGTYSAAASREPRSRPALHR